MHPLARLLLAFVLLATPDPLPAATAPEPRPAQPEELSALHGDWLYVEDRTEGRAAEDRQPPMSVSFTLRVEEDAVVMVRGSGASLREMRLPLDGSTTESPGSTSNTRYRSEWRDGALEFDTEIVRASDDSRIAMFRTELRPTDEGLLVRVEDGVALYRHPADIPPPEPAEGTIADVAWIAGAWVGARGRSSIEERWSPALGGAMLGVSRTVSRERDRMVGFEFLRIVERDGGLVYTAQPGGNPPTEFVLTEAVATRAVFENPRHDFPQRIVYELSPEGALTASIGFINGGRPQRFEFSRESQQ